jgi:hypothetical protein
MEIHMKKHLLPGLYVAVIMAVSVPALAYAEEPADEAGQLIEEMESETETAAETKAGILAETETNPAAQSEAESEAKPAAESEEETEAESETEAEPSLTMDRESVHKIMLAMGDQTLRTTRKFLLKGGVIEDGYKGDAGIGLQQMLVEFGCDITVDGAIGTKTIEALHQVQERFGLALSDQIDQSVFDTLVPLLLMTRGEDSSEVDVQGFYDAARGEGYYQYLKGCAMAGIGKYYSAREAFENSSWQDSQERAAACVQELPDSGLLWRNPDITGTESGLTFKVKGSEDSSGMCFEVYDTDDQLVSVVFVRGSSSAKTDLPAGTYHIKDGSGTEWYGLAETFGPEGNYEYLTFSEEEDVQYDAVLENGQYELAINVSEIEEGATSVGAANVGWEDSFQEE